MLCDQCKIREAVMRYTVIKEGRSEEHHLCAQCAAEKGLDNPLGLAISSLGQILDGLIKDLINEGQEQTISCLGCGLELSEFRSTGRLGCGQCYQAFAPLLRRMIKQIHGSSKHLGKAKVSARPGEKAEPAQSLELLREELARAVRLEEFELAASLRDQIKILESQGKDEPAG